LTNVVTGIALFTPIFGANLFVANGLDKTVQLEKIYVQAIKYSITAIIGGLIIAYVPILSTVFIR
jgi:TRAP-type C4-dicarboxylate transport system permease large subunit